MVRKLDSPDDIIHTCNGLKRINMMQDCPYYLHPFSYGRATPHNIKMYNKRNRVNMWSKLKGLTNISAILGRCLMMQYRYGKESIYSTRIA